MWSCTLLLFVAGDVNLMEHPKLNDSQIPGSIPSEPPDLGNWFQSYRYESPALNSGSFLNELGTQDRERENEQENPCGFSENGSKVQVFVHNMIPDSLESPSLLSEPAHIKNWFSSYVYESPSVNTTDGFGDSLCEESKCAKVGLLVRDCKRGNGDDMVNFSEKRSVGEDVVGEMEVSERLAECDSSWRRTKQKRQPVNEAPGPLESPLLLSEPIDIRNWYSNYVYASPASDTMDGFRDSACKESKIMKDGFMILENKIQNEDGLAGLSKTRSVGEDVVGEKELPEEIAKCNSSWRYNMKERQPTTRIFKSLYKSKETNVLISSKSYEAFAREGSSEFSPLLSEPTDIRNWFSSYQYESPSLDITDGFGHYVCKDRKVWTDGVLVESRNIEKDGDLEYVSESRSYSGKVDVQKLQSEELPKHNQSCRYNKQEGQPVSECCQTSGAIENPTDQNDLCPEYTPNTMQTHGISQAKDGYTSSIFNKEGSYCQLDGEFFQVTGFKPSNNQRCSRSNDGKRPQDLSHSRDITLNKSPEAKVSTEDCLPKSDSEVTPVNAASGKSPQGHKVRDDDGNGISEDGFVTTRKRRFTAKTEDFFSKGHQKKTTGPSVGGKDVVVQRKALADATNFHHPPATMITGKWKCPQKRKPNVGPPLKQLGLEQWIHKL